MLNIGIIFGGNSTEHDVSILTGLHLARNVTEAYHISLIYLTRENQMVVGSKNIDDYIKGKASRAKPFRKWKKLACVINCCHGGMGEDGTLAAVLQFYNLPITSCDAVAGWLQQSKIATRQVLTAAGYLQPRFQVMTTNDLSQFKLPLPVVVKPDMQGSSIGIKIARTNDELKSAIDTALTMGSRVVVEEYIADMQEVNVAVMREQGKIITSALEVVGSERFFSFEEKYFNTDSGFVKKGSQNTDSQFLKDIEPKIKEMAIKAYELFNSSGVVRVDFMVHNNKIILNEINTVPGFMAYHLWLKADIPYGVVIDNLVQEAIARHQKKQQYNSYFKSEILKKNRQLVVEF